MNYPEKAGLLLTDENLYLMFSDVEDKYYEKISVEKTEKGEPVIKNIPADWFKTKRNLVVNLYKEELIPLAQ